MMTSVMPIAATSAGICAVRRESSGCELEEMRRENRQRQQQQAERGGDGEFAEVLVHSCGLLSAGPSAAAMTSCASAFAGKHGGRPLPPRITAMRSLMPSTSGRSLEIMQHGEAFLGEVRG